MKTYNDKIATVGLVVAVIAIIVSILTPEIRNTLLGNNSKPSDNAQTEPTTIDTLNGQSKVDVRPTENVDKAIGNKEKVSIPTKPRNENESIQPNSDNINNLNIFNGEWHSPEYNYSFRINGNRGVATLSNSHTYKVGDVMLLIKSFDGEYYHGTQIYTDGAWHEVTLKLRDKDEIIMKGGVEWIMIRKSN